MGGFSFLVLNIFTHSSSLIVLTKILRFDGYVVADSRWKRDGKVIEILGYYNPKRDWDFKLDLEKYNDWLRKGAQPTPRVKSIFKLQMKKEGQK